MRMLFIVNLLIICFNVFVVSGEPEVSPGSLDGNVAAIKMNVNNKEVELNLKFSNGQMSVKNLEKFGFKATEYKVIETQDGKTFTVRSLSSTSKGLVGFWTGVIKDDKVTGVYEVAESKSTYKYKFKGTFKPKTE